MDVEGIRQRIGADSLAYLSIEGLEKAVAQSTGKVNGHCNACFSGKYPIDIPDWLFEEDRDKVMFEGMWG
jgi:amidophosphoribosyltransferase